MLFVIYFIKTYFYYVLIFLNAIIFYIACPNRTFQAGFLAWIALTPLFTIIHRQQTWGQAFRVAFFFFQLWLSLLLYLHPMTLYNTYHVMGLLVFYGTTLFIMPLIYALVLSSYWLCRHRHPLYHACLVSTLWASLEYVMTILPVGFPLSIAISQWQYPAILFHCRFVGAVGLSCAIIVVNALLARAITMASLRYGLIGLSLPLCLYLSSTLMTSNSPITSTRSLTLIQPNISWQESNQAITGNYLFKSITTALNTLITKSQTTQTKTILVFPELTIPDINFNSDSFYSLFPTLKDTPTLIGMHHRQKNALAFIYHDDSHYYYKSKLIPFFEKRSLITPTHSLPIPLLSHAVLLGPSLCYEILFPHISRRHTRNGAGIIGCLAFNTWFGHSNWPYLHLSYLPLRCSENNRYGFFLNNNGPSLICDTTGRFLSYLPINEEGLIHYNIPIIHNLSLFTRYGASWLWCLLLLLGCYTNLLHDICHWVKYCLAKRQ